MKWTSFSFPSQQRYLVNVVSSITELGTAVSSPFLPSQAWCGSGTGPQKLADLLRPLAEPVTAWHKTHELPARICWHFIWQPFWKTSFSIPPTGLNLLKPNTAPDLWAGSHSPWQHLELDASFFSLSTSFIPCTLLGKTGKHSLTTGWILFPHKSESWGYLCGLANHPNILQICQQIHNDFSNLVLFLLFSSSVLLWQKNSHPPTYPEIAEVDRRKGRW